MKISKEEMKQIAQHFGKLSTEFKRQLNSI